MTEKYQHQISYMQCSAVQCNAMQCNVSWFINFFLWELPYAMQCLPVHHKVVKHLKETYPFMGCTTLLTHLSQAISKFKKK